MWSLRWHRTPRSGRPRTGTDRPKERPMATSAASTYEQVCAEHEWRVPERYNIVADVCDKHARDKPAMIWERYDGAQRELNWGELQDLANQAANWLADHGVTRGNRVAVVL